MCRLIKGSEIGTEVGFISGCVAMLLARASTRAGGESEDGSGAATDGAGSTSRVAKVAGSLSKLLAAFPVQDATNDDLTEQLQRIRAKFKVLVNVAKMPQLEDATPSAGYTLSGDGGLF